MNPGHPLSIGISLKTCMYKMKKGGLRRNEKAAALLYLVSMEYKIYNYNKSLIKFIGIKIQNTRRYFIENHMYLYVSHRNAAVSTFTPKLLYALPLLVYSKKFLTLLRSQFHSKICICQQKLLELVGLAQCLCL